jgi:uncharacterized protein YdiU (UPF0061 family)
VASAVRAQATRRANPAFIPRNHRVEEALSAAVEGADYAPFETLLNILSRPFDDQRSLPPLPNLHWKGKGATEPAAALETLGFVL